MDHLKIATINVNGMNVAVRRRAFFDKIRKGNFDICFLQECHSTVSEEHIWQSEWGGGAAYFSHGLSNSRGVMIILKRDLRHVIKNQICDGDGRLLLLEIEVGSKTFVMGSVYNSNSSLNPMDSVKVSRNQQGISSFNVFIRAQTIGELNPFQGFYTYARYFFI